LILPSARRGFLTLLAVNCGGYPVPGQPIRIGLAVAHVKFHITGRGLGEHQRDRAPQRAAEQGGRTGRLESGHSDTFDRFEAAGPDCRDELLVVLLVLVGVAFAEVGDRPVERVAAAEVLGRRNRVPGPGVGPR